MKYLRQFGVILGFSVLGELCHWLIPWPIPASIYGMAFLFAALGLKLVPMKWVKESGSFLVNILPILFVSPAVGLLGCWDVVAEQAVPIAVIIGVSTVATFAVAGWVTQLLLVKKKGGGSRG